MDRVKGKVAFISGIARARDVHTPRPRQRRRRHHRLRPLRRHRRRIPAGTGSDLAETIRLVEEAGGRIVAARADSRDFDAVDEVLRQGTRQVRASRYRRPQRRRRQHNPIWEWSAEQFRNVLDTNLVGVWHVVKGSRPTSLRPKRRLTHLHRIGGEPERLPQHRRVRISKHIVGLHAAGGDGRRTAQHPLEHHLPPTNVRTGMIDNAQTIRLFRPRQPDATLDDAAPAFATMNMLPVPWISPRT